MGLKIGDISPAAALLGAKGAIRDVASTGALGLLPKMMTSGDKKDDTAAKAVAANAEEEKRKKMAMNMRKQRGGAKMGMKKGGGIESRGNGCCKRTKKCKMY